MNRPSMPTPTPTTFLLAAVALAASLLAPAARAATITVTTTDMTIDAGACTDAENDITISDLSSGDGDTSLPEAICAANGTAGADVIELQAGATYTITEPHNYWYGPTGLPAVSSDITIEGDGAVIERSAADGTPKLRLFYVAGELHPVFVPGEGEEGPLDPTPGDLTLRNLTLRNGLARGGHAGDRGGGGGGLGGAIYNQGSLLLDGVTATGNVAEGGSSDESDGCCGGGGLGGDGGGTGGGGFRGDGAPLFPSGGDFLGDEGGGNTSSGTSAIGGDGGDDGGGGGFVADGENGIGGDGGGDGGALGAGFGGGSGRGGGGVGGGGGWNVGGIGGGGGGFGGGGARGGGGFGGFGGGGGTNVDSTLEDGDGGFGGGGGAFGGRGGPFAGDAGPSGFSSDGGGGGAGLGGVVFNHFGAVTLVNSTLTANTAAGGDGGGDNPDGGDGQGGGGGAGLGGAVFNLNGTVTVESSTLAGNAVTGGAGGGEEGEDGQGTGGAIFHHFQDAGNSGVGNSIVGTTAGETTLTLEDSILADSTADPASPPDPNTFDATNDCFVTDGTTVTLQGANLIESNATGANACGTVSLDADPGLGALTDNGGPTETMAIGSSSPAFDAAGECPPPATDQRGVLRAQSTACDLGAFELDTGTFRSDVVGTKEAGGDLAPGGTAVYAIILTNLGPGLQQDNPEDEFVDVLPSELALISASADAGTATANPGTDTVTWNGEIPAGGTVTITIEATIPEDTPLDTAITNQGTIHYDAEGDGSNGATRLTDDPATGDPEDPTVFPVLPESVLEIPTLGEWGLWLLALLLAAGGAVALRK